MSHPKFSIVVPTRDREATLRFTLQTCEHQDFDDYEIVVSDNSTTTATRELVESIATPRIRYVRPPEPMAMSDHWDFAISQAKGEFITVIGDDDGFLAHGLREIDRIIGMLGAQILRWEPVCYNWPDLPQQEFAKADEILIPLRQVDAYHPIHARDSRRMIQAAANLEVPYSQLPMIYCSMIHRSLIERLRGRQSGRLFLSQCPDVYSSFAFAHLVETYHAVDAPMSINALSGRSNGVGNLYLKGKSSVARDFHSLNAKARLPMHSTVPDVQVMSTYVADSFQRARDALFPEDHSLLLDRKTIVTHCVQELGEWVGFGDEGWVAAKDLILRSLSDEPELQAWFHSEYGSRTSAASLPRKHREPFKRYGGAYLHLDAAQFGVTNVMEAAGLCEKILGYKRDGLNCHVKPEEPRDHKDALDRLNAQLVEKEAVIQNLVKLCKDKGVLT